MAMRRIQVNVSEMSRIIVVRPVDGITLNWGRVGGTAAYRLSATGNRRNATQRRAIMCGT